MFNKLLEIIKNKPIFGWVLFFVVLGGVFLLGLLAASVTERRAEVAGIFDNKRIEISGIEPRNELWGKNYPREYSTWEKTADMDFKSKHLGNMQQDVLEERPEMVVLWAGYAFAMQYEAPRGHKYAIEDVRNTVRTGSPDHEGGDTQPATCWTCKSPDVPRMMHEKGIAEFYAGKWSKMGAEIVNPIGCADCHDPLTMNLTITRPGLIEAFQRQGKDIMKATPQEMRSLVCAQCHVEYYFKGEGKYLTFPWDKGSTVEDMEKYYDEIEHVDWVHKLSKAPMLKAQHPDYEIFMMGPHAQRGLACADCHMPYKSEGGIKYSDHQIMSPLKNVASTCQTCHKDTEEKLKGYVYEYQDKVIEVRNIVEKDLAQVHITAKFAWENGATEAQMKPVLKLIRQAQWRWDFIFASHGAAFHAPVETQRILSHSLDKTHQAMLAFQKVLFALGKTEAPMPDISTKEKAQLYIGLDMKAINAKKEIFKKTMVPGWIKSAKEKKKLISTEG